jgi:hypothetical protein
MENKDLEEDFLFEIVDPVPPGYIPMPEMVLFSGEEQNKVDSYLKDEEER